MSGHDTITEAEIAIVGAIRKGAVATLRRRAARQADLAQSGTATTETGIAIRSGEAAVAHRTAETLAALADEIERWP